MKTVLFVDTLGSHFFQRDGEQWRPAEGPSRGDSLWVLVNLPSESLEVIDLPRLYGSDRGNFLERQLARTFPNSGYRASHLLSGGLLAPGKVMLTGLGSAQEIVARLATIDTTVVGLWGIAAMLTLMAKRLPTPDLLLILPSILGLRILVVKDRIPLLTRHVHCDEGSMVDEILLTGKYLKNEGIFEHGKPLPVLVLGDASSVAAPLLVNADLNLLSVPREFLPKGEAGWLHPIFNQVVSSPSCQLAPLSLRARYLSRRVRHVAYAGAVLSLGVGLYCGQAEIRAVVAQYQRANALQAEAKDVAGEQARLSALIKKTGADPELVRRATQFNAQEITAAPSGEAFLPFAATAIANAPEARVQTLSFDLKASGEDICNRKQTDAGQPPSGPKGSAAANQRRAEIQLTVMLPPQSKTEARKRISAALKELPGVKLLEDPVLAAREATLKGGHGVDSGQTKERWCLSVPWRAGEGQGAL